VTLSITIPGRAAPGIAVVGPEGAADIRAALDLLLHPLRLTATLRA
jgi:hypothetical protein